MKLLFALAVTYGMAMPTQAETLKEVCSQLKEYASIVMQSRQIGMPYDLVVSSIDPAATAPVEDMLVGIIDQAYQFPIYISPSLQETAASDYGLIVELRCYRDNQ